MQFGRRLVIVHYHLFKTAGTSVARALGESFGEGWRYVEGPGGRLLDPHELAEFIRDNPHVRAISSHTAMLPPPVIDGVEVFPVVFVRHPLDRARSVYEFEHRQEAMTPGAQMAKQTDLGGYIRWRLDRVDAASDYSLASFQAWRLAPAGEGSTTRAKAVSAVKRLPYVGTVEDFDASMAVLQRLLAAKLPDLRLVAYKENVTQEESPIGTRLANLRAQLGEDLYRRLEEANRDDLAVWRQARRRYLVSRVVRQLKRLFSL